jgi:hypothetical protein
MIRGIAILLVLLLPHVLVAQVTTRTGEHADFTRVVVTFPVGSEWVISEVESGYAVSFVDELTISTDGFFDRIPFSRIGEVSVNEEENTLILNTVCDCLADNFLWKPDQLVIDIKDKGEDFELEGQEASPVNDDSLTIPETTDVATYFPDWLQSMQAPEAEFTNVIQQFGDVVDVSETERALTQNLVSAMAQGFVTPTDDIVGDGITLELNAIESNSTANSHSGNGPLRTPGINVQMGLGQTGIENQAQNLDSIQCGDSDHYAVEDWGTDQPFHTQIGNLRRLLSNEFDVVDSADVEAIAKTYIYFGFGREAQLVLQMDAQASVQRDALKFIAQILDEDLILSAPSINYSTCDGAISFWHFVGAPADALNANIKSEEVLAAFRNLPSHLQRQISPRLIERLVDIGDTNSAEIISASAQRLSPMNQTFGGASDGTRSDQDVELNTIEDISTTLDRSGGLAEDVFELISKKLSNDAPVDPELLELASAVRFESKGLGIVSDFAAMEIEAHLRNTDFITAASIFEETEWSFTDEQRESIWNNYAESLTKFGADSDFVEFSFTKYNRILDEEVRNLIALRLTDIGITERAVFFQNARGEGSTDISAVGDQLGDQSQVRPSQDAIPESGRDSLVSSNLEGGDGDSILADRGESATPTSQFTQSPDISLVEARLLLSQSNEFRNMVNHEIGK